MLFHLVEAHSELWMLREEIGTAMKHRHDAEKFNECLFCVRMEEAYHHVNTAWNCRHVAERRVWRCSMADFMSWEKLPFEFKDLWLPPSRCRGKARKVINGRLYLTLPRIHIGKAMSAIDGIFRSLGTDRCLTRDGKWKIPKPMTEEAFAAHMRHLYICMNRAWNERKDDSEEARVLSESAVRRHSCFPRAFSSLWPLCKN
jgi:hypothetical protein